MVAMLVVVLVLLLLLVVVLVVVVGGLQRTIDEHEWRDCRPRNHEQVVEQPAVRLANPNVSGAAEHFRPQQELFADALARLT